MNDDLVIEIEDETMEALKQIAERLGLTAEEFAKRAIEESFRNESAPCTAEKSP